jgi:Interferon-induced transmembrane protein
MSDPWTPPTSPASAASPVPNNLILAIVASVLSLLCCLPHGVISLIFALQVNKKAEAGDLEGAANAAKQAKMWAWISIIVAVIWFIVSLVFGVLGALMSALSR